MERGLEAKSSKQITFYNYEVVGLPVWEVSGGNYHNSGQGNSFSSGPVSLGDPYTASFQFFIEYYYQNPYAGGEFDGGCQQDIGGGECRGTDNLVADLSLYLAAPPPQITSITPSGVTQGDRGALTVTGTNLSVGAGDPPRVSLDAHGAPFTISGTPTSSSATFSYDFTGFPTGTYTLSVTNNEGTSNGATFTVASKWPANSCAVNSSPKSSYSAFTSVPGGSGRLTISFSGTAYSSVSQSVSYGPYSTPSSLAANIAALITANYTKSGLTARAFGSNVVYSGNSTLGTVIYTTPGPPIAVDTSPAAAASAETACEEAPSTPAPVCDVVSPQYVLAVVNDSVTWKSEGAEQGRFVNYSLEYWPARPGLLGAPVTFPATITEHLSKAMSRGVSSDGPSNSGLFNDVLGNLGVYNTGTYEAYRCFTFRAPSLGNSPIHVLSYDAAGNHTSDHIKIMLPNGPTILNDWLNPNGSPKDISVPNR